ncbi:MAG: hypothetical protein ABIB43_03285 [archaeon]
MIKMTKNLEEVIVVEWEESERDWGTRPDGCSLHLTIEDSKQYVKEYWDRMPDEVPDEYSRPIGEPYKEKVDEKLYEQVAKSKQGIRLWHGKMREYNLNGKYWVNMK